MRVRTTPHGFRAIGLSIGIITALLLTRLMTTMLIGVKPADPLTIVTMVLVLHLLFR